MTLEAGERAAMTFQSADDWEGDADACWAALSSQSTCRAFSKLVRPGESQADWFVDPPLDPNAACPAVHSGDEFDLER